MLASLTDLEPAQPGIFSLPLSSLPVYCPNRKWGQSLESPVLYPRV